MSEALQGPVGGPAAPVRHETEEAAGERGWLAAALVDRGVSRRRFLQWCSAMTAMLALPRDYAPRIVAALETGRKPVVVWLEFQDCAGNSESMLRASHPSVADVVLDNLSWEYHETIMAGAGAQAEAALKNVLDTEAGKFICIIEGAIPTNEDGTFCMIGGKTALSIAQEVTSKAALTIAVGDCAWDGGFVTQGPTGAKGVGEAVSPKTLINLGGCPHNSANTAAVILHYLTFKEAPALDQYNRPLFAYGHLIHDQCERRSHFDAGRYVEKWGDEGHRNGWCLYKMGCKGPQTTFNCPIVRWNDGTNWPIGAGHGCVGCASPKFWDRMSPFYDRLPNVKLIGVDTTAQTIGLAAVGGVAALTAVHAGGVLVRRASARRRGTGGGGSGGNAPAPAATAGTPAAATAAAGGDPTATKN
jgi:hydrogenase small subunit